ncbi:hypothetical protein AWV80_16160 [Cupriavidus sp. UYMU48A]|nr:hypothetical protein AWV80_16160 [Cupriavidus sp. UYMU48A]
MLAAIAIALIPPPEGLAQHTWYYFAIFVGVIVGLMLEPLSGGAIGMIAVTLVAILDEGCSSVRNSLPSRGIDPGNASLARALSRFANSTV